MKGHHKLPGPGQHHSRVHNVINSVPSQVEFLWLFLQGVFIGANGGGWGRLGSPQNYSAFLFTLKGLTKERFTKMRVSCEGQSHFLRVITACTCTVYRLQTVHTCTCTSQQYKEMSDYYCCQRACTCTYLCFLSCGN